jgi:hypothetical protein
MGAARDDEDSNPGTGYAPKLILAGRLSGSIDGRPVVITADAAGVTFDVASFRSAWNLRAYGDNFLPVVRFLKASGIPLTLRVAGIVSLPLLPTAGALIKLLAPALAKA